MKAAQWLDQAKKVKGWESDYRAAKELGLSRSTVSVYRSKADATLDEDTAVKLANVLGINAAGIIIDQVAERSKNPEVRAALSAEAARLYIMFTNASRKLRAMIAPRGPQLAV